MEIRPARAADFDAATGLLHNAGLPVEDLTEDRIGDFLVASIDGSAVGVIGLEVFAGVGLLRSLVVDPARRGARVGRALVRELEAHARRCGLSELWLLTIDADGFFAKLGYRARERDAAPDEIRHTAEFTTLCPGDAVLMQKTL